MKFALVDGEKVEATKGGKGKCQSCDSEMITHCGPVYADHWQHKRKYKCDSWWETETPWQRAWKNYFPKEWQEIRHHDQNTGEVHIADVKTESGYVLEFQHSIIKLNERIARGMFYPKLNWVVDVGSSPRKTDKKQLQKIIIDSTTVVRDFLIRLVVFPDECRLLRERCNGKDFVFFDCKGAEGFEEQDFWMLFPMGRDGRVYLSPIFREQFIKLHQTNTFDEAIKNIVGTINKRIQISNIRITESPLQMAKRNMANRRKKKFRF